MKVNYIEPFAFANFINKDWDIFYTKFLREAKNAADDASAESMGGGEISRVPLMPGKHTQDQKYLSQFHAGPVYGHENSDKAPFTSKGSMMTQAFHHRYSTGMANIGKHYDTYGTIPEDRDYVNEIRFKIPGARKKVGEPYYIVYTGVEGQKGIYVGHSEAAKKLSNPAKRHSQEHINNPKFKEGLGLREIDPNNAEHLKQYEAGGHGYHDYDFSDIPEPENIDEIPDEKIVTSLSKKWQIMYNELPVDKEDNKIISPDLQNEILKKREKMKEAAEVNIEGEEGEGEKGGQTATGFEFIKPNKSSEFIRDWLNAAALGIIDTEIKNKKEVEDPITGKMVPLQWISPEDANRLTNRNLSAGFDKNTARAVKGMTTDQARAARMPAKEIEKLQLPVIDRKISYRIEDPNGRVLDTKENKEIQVPYLPDVKSLPKLPLTDTQRALLAHRERPDLIPAGSDEEITKRFKEIMQGADSPNKSAAGRASTPKDFAAIIKNWDIWSPEQKELYKKEARTLPNLAKAYHVSNSEHKKQDPYSYQKNNYILGVQVNQNRSGQANLGIPPDSEEMNQFIEKYRGQMAGEAAVAIEEWLKYVEKDGSQPKEVIDTIRKVSSYITALSTYYLLTWLNSPKAGIFDPPLLTVDKENSKEDAKKARKTKVKQMLRNLAQATINNFPSRRAREKNNEWRMKELDYQTKGKEGTVGIIGSTIDAEKAKGKKEITTIIPWDSRRGITAPTLRSEKEYTVAGKHEEVPAFLHSLTMRIKNQLGGSVAVLIDKAEKRLMIAITAAQNLAQRYDKELTSQYPDPTQREEEVNKKVREDLPKELANGHGSLFADMTPIEEENLMATLKKELVDNYWSQQNHERDDPEFKNKFHRTMEEFWDDLVSNDEAILPKYNVNSGEFEQAGMVIHIPGFAEPGSNVKRPTSASYVKKLMYDIGLLSANDPSMSNEIEKSIDKHALDIYSTVLSDVNHTDKSDEEMIRDLMAAGVKPVQMHNLRHPVEMPQPIQKPMQQQVPVAARPIKDVMDDVVNFNTPQEMVAKINGLLARANEIKSRPELAANIENLLKEIRNRRFTIMKQFPQIDSSQTVAMQKIRQLAMEVKK